MSRPCSSQVYQVTPDPGELGDLFATQARRTTADPGRQADVLRLDPLTPAAQERRQLATSGVRVDRLDGRDVLESVGGQRQSGHVVIIASRIRPVQTVQAGSQVVLIPG